MKRLMISIYDNEQVMKYLKQTLHELSLKNGWNLEIVKFQLRTEQMHHIEDIDIVFLDINMPQLDVIKIGKYIHSINKDCKIIIISNNAYRLKDIFKINAFRFITKPFDIEEIEEAIHSVWNSRIGKEKILLYEQRIKFWIEEREIAYFMSYDSYVECMVSNRLFRKETSLNELEEVLDMRLFFRINRRYIVNILWIQDYKDGVINLDGSKLSVSRRKKKKFEKFYIDFDLKAKSNRMG